MRTKRAVVTFVILSQTLHDRDANGKRFPHGEVRRSKYRSWTRYINNASNFKAAVNFLTRQLVQRHIGGLVLIQKQVNGFPTNEISTLFQAKWGHDNKPFTKFQYAVGDYWKKRAGLYDF